MPPKESVLIDIGAVSLSCSHPKRGIFMAHRQFPNSQALTDVVKVLR